jgi:hypothetical protein
MVMHARSILAALVLLAAPAAARAQHAAPAFPARVAPPEAAQFDFLVGQWELTVKPKATSLAARLHGAPRLVGVWKAWRAFDGWGIEDELRIMDGSGNPISLSHTMRAYDATAGQWAQSGFDVYRGQFRSATAQWKDGEMLVSASGTDSEGKPVLSRFRFYQITSTGFTARQDRSVDNGKTWEEGVLTIEARRVAATAER